MKSTGTKATAAHEWVGIGPRDSVFEGAWRDLAHAYGGVGKLAEQVGVGYTTLYRWAVKGDVVPAPARIVLGMLAAQKGLPNPATA